MRRNCFKIRPGILCNFDSENTLKQTENGINSVIVVKMKKYRPFHRSLWIVKDLNNTSNVFVCHEYNLIPSNACVIRFPSDLPEFNDLDVACMHRAIDILSPSSRIFEKEVNRLKAICEKIELCNKMREV